MVYADNDAVVKSMKSLNLITVLILLLSQSTTSVADSTDLILLDNVFVTQNVTNVAEVINSDLIEKEILNVLSKISIAKTPMPGYTKILSRDYVNRIINNSKFTGLSNIKVRGAKQVTIQRKSKQINVEDYTKASESYLYKYLSRDYVDIKLDLVGSYKDLVVPDSDIKIQYTDNTYVKANGRMCVMLKVVSDGKFFTQLPIWFKVDAKLYGYLLNADIAQGEQVSEFDIQSTLLDAINVNGKLVKNIDELSLWVASKTIKKGQVLLLDDFIPKTDVVNGSNVRVVVNVGNVTLHTQAIAKQNGNVGQTIELFNKKNREIFKGIVINENYVKSL